MNKVFLVSFKACDRVLITTTKLSGIIMREPIKYFGKDNKYVVLNHKVVYQLISESSLVLVARKHLLLSNQ